MLTEKFPQEALVRAGARVVQRRTRIARQEVTERIARLGGENASGGGETAAPRAQCATRAVAEHHGGGEHERRMALAADVECRREAEIGDDPPRAGQRGRQRALGRGERERIQRRDDGVEQRAVGRVAPEPQRQLGDGRRSREAADKLLSNSTSSPDCTCVNP